MSSTPNKTLLLVAALAVVTPVAAQSVNIDIGPDSEGAGPSASYAAAGLPGFWNRMEAFNGPTYSVRDLAGQVTPITVTQFGGTEHVVGNFGAGDPEGDDAVLLEDALVTHTTIENCLFVNNLQNGVYEVLIYAYMPTDPSVVNRTRVDTNPDLVDVSGAWTGQHVVDKTYTRHIIRITNGFLGPHSGVPQGGDLFTGAALNGLQLRLLDTNINTQPSIYFTDLELYWSAVGGLGTAFDVVRGDLTALRAAAGDFSQATESCDVDSLVATRVDHSGAPDTGEGWFYLTRVQGGSYDTTGASQVGGRDAGVSHSPGACP